MVSKVLNSLFKAKVRYTVTLLLKFQNLYELEEVKINYPPRVPWYDIKLVMNMLQYVDIKQDINQSF